MAALPAFEPQKRLGKLRFPHTIYAKYARKAPRLLSVDCDIRCELCRAGPVAGGGWDAHGSIGQFERRESRL